MIEKGLSKRKSLAILKELRDGNKIKIVKLAGGGTNIKVVTSDMPGVGTSDVPGVGTSDNSYLAVQQVSAISNSYTARTTITATNKFFDEVKGKEKNMGYEFFGGTSSSDNDDLRERQKYEAVRKAEYQEGKEKKAEARREMHRSKIDPLSWTCKDVAFEFSDRLADMWNIKPFSVIQSRFVPALSAFRKQHDTNGALELEMVNMFFSSLEAEKYEDGNHLWRAFLYKAPSMVQTARERVVTVEQVETAIIKDQELTNRKLALLEDEDV